ncbi:hypothetical protein FHS94_001822 [Sphingomonas aerophila]|uniref:Uncharacterized protein n=1 Tax=Sphingomonas aerophila TaxID=1344948 RepID=A0A7W9EUA2_9SPHN|nr:hypothetical protein [Sphingomonas aerophila]
MGAALALAGCGRASGDKGAGQGAPSAHAATGVPRTAAMRVDDEAAARNHPTWVRWIATRTSPLRAA